MPSRSCPPIGWTERARGDARFAASGGSIFQAKMNERGGPFGLPSATCDVMPVEPFETIASDMGGEAGREAQGAMGCQAVRAWAQVVVFGISGRGLDDACAAGAAGLLKLGERCGLIIGLIETLAEHPRIFKRHIGPLGEEGQRWMGRIAKQHGVTIRPCFGKRVTVKAPEIGFFHLI